MTMKDQLLDLYAHLDARHITELEFLEQAEAMTTAEVTLDDLLNQLSALVPAQAQAGRQMRA